MSEAGADKRIAILRFLLRFSRANGCTATLPNPTASPISRSVQSVAHHLDRLHREGLIDRGTGPRALQVTPAERRNEREKRAAVALPRLERGVRSYRELRLRYEALQQYPCERKARVTLLQQMADVRDKMFALAAEEKP